MIREILIFSFFCQLAWSQLTQLTETQIEAGSEINLTPGTTISGGIDPTGDEDQFQIELDGPSENAVLFASLTYTHSSDFFAPQTHIRGEIVSSFLVSGGETLQISRGFLTAGFLLGNNSNTLRLRVPMETLLFNGKPDITFSQEHFIRIFTDTGRNPSYDLTLQLEFSEDRFDDGRSNETAIDSAELLPTSPSGISFGDEQFTFHRAQDIDGFEFTPQVTGNYQVRVNRSTVAPSYGRPVVEVFNLLGQKLADGIDAADRSTMTLAIFSALAGEIYRIKVTPESGETYQYDLSAALLTTEEPTTPSGSPAQDPNFILATTPIPPEGLTFTGFSSYDTRDFDEFDFLNIEVINYLVLIETENSLAPTAAASGFGSSIGVSPLRNERRFIRAAPFDDSLRIQVWSQSREQLGSYSIFIRPENDFDRWRVTQSNSRFLEGDFIRGTSAMAYFALDRDPWTSSPQIFQIVSSPSGISIILPLPTGGTQADILLQQSSDMKNWVPVSSSVLNQPSPLIPKGTNGNVTITYPGNSPSLFVRLLVPESGS